MSASELLACPFCGADKPVVHLPNCYRGQPYDPGDRAFPIARCRGCFTDVPGRDWDISGDSARTAWNNRPQLPAADGVEALLAARYRWLRTNASEIVWLDGNGELFSFDDLAYLSDAEHEELDTAIDAAIASRQGVAE